MTFWHIHLVTGMMSALGKYVVGIIICFYVMLKYPFFSWTVLLLNNIRDKATPTALIIPLLDDQRVK